jgi:hypothetical protein
MAVTSITASAPGAAAASGRRPVWAFGPRADLAIALCWVPVFLAARILTAGPGAQSTHRLQQGVVLALLVSFLHQPLTFGLVYGDRRQFVQHPRLFTWAPVVAVSGAAVAAADAWWVVVPVAALWNLQHTLQQRYGIQRIYAGKSRYGSARLDRALAYVPMAAVLVAVAAMPATPGLVTRSGLDPVNAQGVRLLVDLRPISVALLGMLLAATAAVVVALVRQEARAGARANPAKWLYQASSLGLVASIVVDPAAGFIAYVSAHAVEYGIVVYRTAARRYGPGAPPRPPGTAPGLLDRLARGPAGRAAYFGAIVLGALALHASVHGVAFNAVVFSIGALHFTYDAVIWKLRKPALALDLGLAGAGAPGALGAR